jgi:hypothetical protein
MKQSRRKAGPAPNSIGVSPHRIRQMFNQGRYLDMVENGRLSEIVVESRHPSAPLAPVPFCTESQFASYQAEDGTEIAYVHQYVQPNGELGASGMPDPKRLLHDGQQYHALPEKRR